VQRDSFFSFISFLSVSALALLVKMKAAKRVTMFLKKDIIVDFVKRDSQRIDLCYTASRSKFRLQKIGNAFLRLFMVSDERNPEME
jgi:hypothetical protein